MPRDDAKALAGPRPPMPRRSRRPVDTDAAARQAVLEAQTALVRVQTELRALELRRRQGDVIERAVAEAAREADGQRVRTYWLRWPAAVAPGLAATFGLDADAVADALMRLVRTALAELADADRRPTRRRR